MMLLPSVSDASRYGDGIFVFRHETGEVELLVEDFSVLEVE
jgi:hypothetical protein